MPCAFPKAPTCPRLRHASSASRAFPGARSLHTLVCAVASGRRRAAACAWHVAQHQSLVHHVCDQLHCAVAPLTGRTFRSSRHGVHYVCGWSQHVRYSHRRLPSPEPLASHELSTFARCLNPLWPMPSRRRPDTSPVDASTFSWRFSQCHLTRAPPSSLLVAEDSSEECTHTTSSARA